MRPQEQTVLDMLAPGELVRNVEINAALGGVSEKHRHVVMYRVKRHLKARGVPVRTIWGIGYIAGQDGMVRVPEGLLSPSEREDYKLLRHRAGYSQAEALRKIGRGDLVDG